MTMGWLWIAVVFVGAFALAGAMIWSRVRNQQSDVSKARVERNAQKLRDELNARDNL